MNCIVIFLLLPLLLDKFHICKDPWKVNKHEDEDEDYSRQKLDLHQQFCRTNVAKNSGINIGIKLYNKLLPVIKNLEMTQEFKSRVKDFLMQHTFYSVDEFVSF